jgi:hypothetical protein
MAPDDPFTLDLFGNADRSGGPALGITAFPSDFAGDPEPDPQSGDLSEPVIDHDGPVRDGRGAQGSDFYLPGSRDLARSGSPASVPPISPMASSAARARLSSAESGKTSAPN